MQKFGDISLPLLRAVTVLRHVVKSRDSQTDLSPEFGLNIKYMAVGSSIYETI
jgi:hypothetical protein